MESRNQTNTFQCICIKIIILQSQYCRTCNFNSGLGSLKRCPDMVFLLTNESMIRWFFTTPAKAWGSVRVGQIYQLKFCAFIQNNFMSKTSQFHIFSWSFQSSKVLKEGHVRQLLSSHLFSYIFILKRLSLSSLASSLFYLAQACLKTPSLSQRLDTSLSLLTFHYFIIFVT